jgi:uncharacterized protein YfiM (DUF2279 family)
MCLAVSLMHSAQAGDLSGEDDPALQAAIELWLQDNDADSLAQFAALASAGNKAARLLLARIEATDQAASDFVNSLSRKQRMELFRSDSGAGLFRPSWLKTEKLAGNKVAAVLLESSNTSVNVPAIRELYQIGEQQAAYDLIREVAGVGSPQDREELASLLAPGAELMPYLRALNNPVSGFTPGHAALQTIIGGAKAAQSGIIFPGPEDDTTAAVDFVEFGYQNGVEASRFDALNSYYAELAKWIDTAAATAPIATLCRRVCTGEAVKSCVVTAFGLAGGYYKVIKFDSPLEALIEQSRYVTSDRAVGMLLRRISFVKTAAGTPMIADADLGERTACLAKTVAEIRAQRN